MMDERPMDDNSFHPQVLGQRVLALESGVQQISVKLDNLAGMFSSRGQTNWNHIMSAGSLLTAVLGLVGAVVYLPIKDNQIRAEVSIRTLSNKTEATFDKLLERTEARALQIQTQLVPRAEQEMFWRNYERTLDRVNRRIDKIDARNTAPVKP